MNKKITYLFLILLISVNCKKNEVSLPIPRDFLSWVDAISRGEISGNNPINTLLYIEAEAIEKQNVAKTYKILGDIIKTVKSKVNPSSTPIQQLRLVFQILERDFNISYLEKVDKLFSQSLQNKKRDCDTGSYIYLTIAHELKWPLSAIKVPEHIYLCWDDGKEKFNFETTTGEKIDDPYYIIKHNIHKTSIEEGVFFKKMTARELTGNFFFDRGNYYLAHKENDRAISDFTRAVEYNPKDAESYFNRGILRIVKNDFSGALNDFNTTIRLNPNSKGIVFYFRAAARYGLTSINDALPDFTEAINRDSTLYKKLPDEIKKKITRVESDGSNNNSEHILYALRFNLNEGISVFTKLHNSIFDLKTSLAYSALLPSINSQAINYTPEKELYILIKEEIVYVNLLNNEGKDINQRYLSEIKNYAKICSDKYEDPTTMIEYYLLNNLYYMYIGAYELALDEIKKYESIVSKFNRPDDLAYIASIKECVRTKNKEKGLIISRPKMKRMFDEHFEFIVRVKNNSDKMMKTLIK